MYETAGAMQVVDGAEESDRQHRSKEWHQFLVVLLKGAQASPHRDIDKTRVISAGAVEIKAVNGKPQETCVAACRGGCRDVIAYRHFFLNRSHASSTNLDHDMTGFGILFLAPAVGGYIVSYLETLGGGHSQYYSRSSASQTVEPAP